MFLTEVQGMPGLVTGAVLGAVTGTLITFRQFFNTRVYPVVAKGWKWFTGTVTRTINFVRFWWQESVTAFVLRFWMRLLLWGGFIYLFRWSWNYTGSMFSGKTPMPENSFSRSLNEWMRDSWIGRFVVEHPFGGLDVKWVIAFAAILALLGSLMAVYRRVSSYDAWRVQQYQKRLERRMLKYAPSTIATSQQEEKQGA
jgi:hypothetical protein